MIWISISYIFLYLYHIPLWKIQRYGCKYYTRKVVVYKSSNTIRLSSNRALPTRAFLTFTWGKYKQISVKGIEITCWKLVQANLCTWYVCVLSIRLFHRINLLYLLFVVAVAVAVAVGFSAMLIVDFTYVARGIEFKSKSVIQKCVRWRELRLIYVYVMLCLSMLTMRFKDAPQGQRFWWQ